MQQYFMSTDEVLKGVHSTAEGISSEEAAKHLAQNGENRLQETKKDSLAKRFFKQMTDPMIIILIIAAVVSAVTDILENGMGVPTDSIIILVVVIVNAILGVYQESKAEKAIEALQKMAAATSKVLRDGQMQILPSSNLVVGDVVLLEAGDAVPADGRLLEAASLKIEEAALTGESVPVNKKVDALPQNDGKDVPLGDRKNMIYTGSSVAYGRARAVITATGMDTEMGKIADAIANAEDSRTPLQIKLAQLSKILSFAVLGICLFIFAFRLVMNWNALHLGLVLDSFMVAVSLAVAAIPEGLVAVVTVVLSIGVTNMSKKNAIIRRLTAVETLGCAQIICSDKTGTLTQNKMTVVETVGTDVPLLARAMSLCSDAQPSDAGDAVGEPTECALVNFATKEGLDKRAMLQETPRVGEAPFDSMRKMMSTIHKVDDAHYVQYTKGAPDEILKRCDTYIENGQVLPLTEEKRTEFLQANKAMADKALRVLAAASVNYNAMPQSTQPTDIEHNMCFIGMTGMIDPVRPEVAAAITRCRAAGIRPIMITGDHRDTAVAIAMNLGIISDPSEAITGAQLDEISDEDFAHRVKEFSVYARVQPEHKVRIVNAWRENGCITAMTGDGVNDAPSIKSADIGVGMGITGTDVTKNVADMVLADDNFATIVGAVGEGRRIYDNIRKAIQFLLGSNLSEVLSIFVATMLNFTVLKPVHLLWINLVTDTFPALALGTEAAEENLMERKPRNSNDGIFAGGLGVDVLYQGSMLAAVTLLAYFIGEYMETGVWRIANSADGMTMAFLTMSIAEVFHSFNLRSQRGSSLKLTLHGKHNLLLYGAMAASLVLTTAVIYVPFLANAFGFTPISLAEYGIALLLAFAVIPLVEIIKLCQRSEKREK